MFTHPGWKLSSSAEYRLAPSPVETKAEPVPTFTGSTEDWEKQENLVSAARGRVLSRLSSTEAPSAITWRHTFQSLATSSSSES